MKYVEKPTNTVAQVLQQNEEQARLEQQGALLYTIRNHAPFSRDQVARIMHYTVQNISDWENGKSAAPADYLPHLAKLCLVKVPPYDASIELQYVDIKALAPKVIRLAAICNYLPESLQEKILSYTILLANAFFGKHPRSFL